MQHWLLHTNKWAPPVTTPQAMEAQIHDIYTSTPPTHFHDSMVTCYRSRDLTCWVWCSGNVKVLPQDGKLVHIYLFIYLRFEGSELHYWWYVLDKYELIQFTAARLSDINVVSSNRTPPQTAGPKQKKEKESIQWRSRAPSVCWEHGKVFNHHLRCTVHPGTAPFFSPPQ